MSYLDMLRALEESSVFLETPSAPTTETPKTPANSSFEGFDGASPGAFEKTRTPNGGPSETINPPPPPTDRERAQIARCIGSVRESKAGAPVAPTVESLSPSDKAAIGDWLDRVDESDPEIRAQILDRARTDTKARAAYLADAHTSRIRWLWRLRDSNNAAGWLVTTLSTADPKTATAILAERVGEPVNVKASGVDARTVSHALQC